MSIRGISKFYSVGKATINVSASWSSEIIIDPGQSDSFYNLEVTNMSVVMYEPSDISTSKRLMF
jgi:hypothetical protein